MAFSNSEDWDQLQPIWVCGTDSGTLDEKVFVSNGGSTLTSSNGNNGQNMAAYVKGVARGGFKIQFKLGYTWGYSRFFMANISVINQNSPNDGNYNSSGVNGLRFVNNNSNNVLFIHKNVNGTSTQIVDSTGVDDTIISLWRDTSNVVKYKVGSASTTTVGTFTDTFVFGTTQQSPASCELIMAMNLNATPS